MMLFRGLLGLCGLGFLVLASSSTTSAADPPPSFSKDIKPFLAKYCLECHQGPKGKAGLDVSTYDNFLKGGISFPGFVPGKPNESFAVTLTEGKSKPVMPPSKSKQPTAAEKGLLRAWVVAGAKDDSTATTVTLPDIAPRQRPAPPVGALAYRPDGKLLSAAAYKDVLFLDPSKPDVVDRLSLPSPVTSVAFSRDGQRLAVACGSTGTAGEVRLYALVKDQVQPKPEHVIAAHADIIHEVTFNPSGTILATTGYDRLVRLWDVASGKELRTLKDHSDAVYGLAFNPDGRLLASAAADRAVKVWDVASGKRLYTLADATDWVYAVAWSPDGKHLAAAGVDRSIRVWEVNGEGGKLVQSAFAHEGAVLRLIYAADGKTLYSLSEDRSAKAWDAMRLVEKKIYARQPDSVLALAVAPDHKQLALGRYDGALVLLDEATGQVQAQPLPAKPKPPALSKLTPTFGPRGQAVRITFEGKELDSVTEVTSNVAGMTAKLLAEGRTATSVQADVTFPAQTPAGTYPLGLKGAGGTTATLPFTVDLFGAAPQQGTNDTPAAAQRVTLPITVAGALRRAGAVDYYRFEARDHQQVGVQAVASDGKFEPVLQLTDATGNVVADGGSALGHTCARAGTYILSIRDLDYRGGNLAYRLHVGEVPVVTALHPPGSQRGTETEFRIEGVHLGDLRSLRFKAPADAVIGSRVPLPLRTPLGPPLGPTNVVAGEFPESLRDDELPGTVPGIVSVPGTANGRIIKPSQVDDWRFTARKGQRLIVEVNARRIGSPLDSFIEIRDENHRPVARATLRCVAKTFSTFRDHDSKSPGIRIETWNELTVNDHLYVGNELIRIRDLPKNPDDDCQFFSVDGQRLGYLDTTPTHHAQGVPMYKVAIHPPGTTFPPNGFPVIAVSYRNDDGGPGFGKDSRLFFDPPADGEYRVQVGDARGHGGRSYFYRLTVRPPRPSFQVRLSPTAPSVWRGGAVPITVTADRADGFDGPIAVQLADLPPGFSAPRTTIPAGENSTAFALFADTTAPLPEKAAPLKLVARATLDGQDVVREVIGGRPQLVEPGDIVTTVEKSEVTVQPGQSVKLTVAIDRRNGFKGRVPMDVRGLPHGVRVLDIGLNGILITEQDTRRTIEIYCEPWVKATEQPFVVLARREGKNSEHAAKSVLLRVQEK